MEWLNIYTLVCSILSHFGMLDIAIDKSIKKSVELEIDM